jgi:hypothetical protein
VAVVEEEAPKEPLVALVVAGRYVPPAALKEEEDGQANINSPVKGKPPAKGKGKEVEVDTPVQPTIAFTVPSALRFLYPAGVPRPATATEGEEQAAVPDGDGRELSIEVALNGQDYVKVESTLAFAQVGGDAMVQGKGSKGAKKK